MAEYLCWVRVFAMLLTSVAGPVLAQPENAESERSPSRGTTESAAFELGGDHTLRLDAGLTPTIAFESPVVDESRVSQLELSLRLPTYAFNPVSFISSTRTLFTAVLETYCGIGLFIPDGNGYTALGVTLGAGCLVGAAVLYVVGVGYAIDPPEREDAQTRLVEFYTLQRAGELDTEQVDRLEDELRAAAARDERRRVVEVIFGGLNLIAAGIIVGLAVEGEMAVLPATSIATGTGLLGILGLGSLWVRTPSEQAWTQIRHLRAERR